MKRTVREPLVLLAALLFMTAGPAWFALTGEELSYAPAWRMFESVGVGYCDVQFAHAGSSLDRYAPFGAVSAMDAPDEVRHIGSAEQAIEVAHTLCAHAGVATISVAMRCAEPSGWDEVLVPEVACR